MDNKNTYKDIARQIGEKNPGGWQYLLGDALGSVRQLTDEAGEITLAKSYLPYGEAITGAGGAASAYGYTGEWVDGYIELLNLRSRLYAPRTGRFLTKDTWQGDYTRPLSLNGWNYVEANPINFIDPTGKWRWWLTPSIYHFIVEQYYENFPTNQLKQLEFPIPGTPFRHADMFNSALGDVYEIEPWFSRSIALPQVRGYVADLLTAAAGSALTGSYFGTPYDWNSTPFHIGTGIDWPGKLRIILPNFPMVDLVADYVGNGTVIYWVEPNALSLFGALPFLVPNKHLVKPPNWIPSQYAPQPAYAVTLYEACGYALIAVGGTVIVVTIVEDIATAGVGTFDDAITVPAGILFINFGQRIAALVPASAP